MNEQDQALLDIQCCAANIVSRAQCAVGLLRDTNVIDARFQYNTLSGEIQRILEAISKRENFLANEALPPKAYVASQDGYAEVYVAAKTSSKARWIVVSGMREAGLKGSAQFHLISVRRAPKYDAWAKTAKRHCHGHDDMPKGV